MSASNAFENALALLLYNNTGIATIGDATGIVESTADGNFYVALHTADPGEAGNQSTNECDYTGYARVAVARTVSGWTVTDNVATNAAIVAFGENTGDSQTATHFSIGAESSGATLMLKSNALTAQLVISPGVTPSFAIGQISNSVE